MKSRLALPKDQYPLYGLTGQAAKSHKKLVHRHLLLSLWLCSSWTACGPPPLVRPRLAVPRDNPRRWLEPGPQTKPSPQMLALAAQLKSQDPVETLRAIHRWVTAHRKPFVGHKSQILRRRTASQIFRSMDLSGCGDWGVVLATLFRAAGIPTVYVETIQVDWARRWVEGEDFTGYEGHVFLEVFVRGHWLLVDSTRGWYWSGYDPKNPSLPLGYYAFAKGKDAWDLGITSASVLERSLEHIADYLADHPPEPAPASYRRGFLTPTVLLIADAATVAARHQIHRGLYFKHWIFGSKARGTAPSEFRGLDALAVVSSPADAREVAHLLGLTKKQATLLLQTLAVCQDSACARTLYLELPDRRVCLLVTKSKADLVSRLRSLLQIRPAHSHAVSTEACRMHARGTAEQTNDEAQTFDATGKAVDSRSSQR